MVHWQETSLRPDIKLGRVPSRSNSASPLPPPIVVTDFSLPPPSSANLDYTSAFVCRLPLKFLQPRPSSRAAGLEAMDIGFVNIMEKVGISDQSHLTQVVVGCDEDLQECEPAKDILQQVYTYKYFILSQYLLMGHCASPKFFYYGVQLSNGTEDIM